MNLLDLVHRTKSPEPWAEGAKIPWDDAGFSERMLREHLSQDHDAASRRFAKIDAHVGWIHNQLLCGRPSSILDLGCGPGLYTSRLARLGHECVGIDFSPASVAYAAEAAQREGLRCSYLHEDIRTADYRRVGAPPGTPFHLVMLIFGEFNTFRPFEAQAILRKAHDALSEGDIVLLEPSTFEAIRQSAQSGTRWYATPNGLFSPQPHLCLEERFWDQARCTETTRYYIVDAPAGKVTRYAASSKAYTGEDIRVLLTESGFTEITFFASLAGAVEQARDGLCVVAARKQSLS